MTVLTAEQVAAAAYIGGWRNSEIVTAVATSFAESSYNTRASNFCCYGLWQINESAHKQIFASGKWDNPADNAKMAYQIYREAGGSWGPWSGYGNGNYKLALPKARTALQQLTAGLSNGKTAEQILGSQSTNGNGVAPVNPAGVTDSLNALVDPHTWLRVGVIVIGIMALGLGVIVMAKDNPSVRKLANVATTIIPETKIAKVAVGAVQAKKAVDTK
jgi:hypothetical protein